MPRALHAVNHQPRPVLAHVNAHGQLLAHNPYHPVSSQPHRPHIKPEAQRLGSSPSPGSRPAQAFTVGCDRRASLTEHLRARVPAPLPRLTRTPQAAGDAPTNLTPTFIQQRTAFLEASMASLRTRAATLTATVSSLVTQRNDFLTNLQGTQQSVNALSTTPSSRTTTAAARALAAVQAHTGTNTPT